MTDKEHLLVDAEARAKLPREGGLSDLDPLYGGLKSTSRPTGTANLPAGAPGNCKPAPHPCGSMAPRAPIISQTAERFVFKTSDKGTADQRQTTTKKTASSTRKSTAMKPANSTAGSALSTTLGETKKISSFAS